jgi:prepilin-type N-terminal cleavage/methylation domain-containing protein
MRRKVGAFTLIELLIVVAIIAILAAIAVPNFLEAQTRSKIARVSSDMRSLATAIESYTVDNNKHPIGWEDGVVTAPGAPLWDWVGPSTIGPFRQLTTPVAYMSSIPMDVFAIYAKGASEGFGVYYLYSDDAGAYLASYGNAARGFRWSMRSCGPSFQVPARVPPEIFADTSPNDIYDATNGTKSVGWLIRTNKGEGWAGCKQ